MRILMLVRHIARSDRAWQAAGGLAASGHLVTVLACARTGELLDERPDGFDICRVVEPPPMIPGWDEIAASLQDALVLFERGIETMMDEPADVLVADGWAVATAAVGLRRSFDAPLVALLEPRRIRRRGRRWGRGDVLIEETERWLASEAARVVVRSPVARAIVIEQLSVPADRVRISRRPAGPRLADICREAAEAPITIEDARRALAR